MGENTTLCLPVTPYIVKTLWNSPGLCIFGPELHGTIYFGLSAEMTKIQAVFTFCGWLETISEGGKSPVTPLILQIGQKSASLGNPDIFQTLSRIKAVIKRP